ncbi:hypothetical protein [Pedobacter miscanthi]|nr:hypothetical protein [Pedobacter miscanthi]
MKRKNNPVTQSKLFPLANGTAVFFPFHTQKPQSSYPFDRLFAIKPKNPI